MGNIIPPEPTLIFFVLEAASCISKTVAELAICGMLWCSANQILLKPFLSVNSATRMEFSMAIFASDPSASRVMINGHYLKPGDGFGPLLVERITEDGVVLSKNGQFFRVGTVRDWVSPR